MAYILNIDTAIHAASLSLANDGQLIAESRNEQQKDHAAWLQPAIQNLLISADVALHELAAVAVSIGPGSYTGLRIGLSTAKGLCYALNIPLIAISTLEMMAAAATGKNVDLLCPMIDARRMEVFTAVYKKNGEAILAPAALVLDQYSFGDLLNSNRILFFGDGSTKFKHLTSHPYAFFDDIQISSSLLIPLSYKRFQQRSFDNLAYTEPIYIKNFHSVIK